MNKAKELTDEQWAVIEPLFPELAPRQARRGRPPQDRRAVFDGVLWILHTGARWQDMPERFPPYQTCHRRFQRWVREGTLKAVLESLAEDLRSRGKLDLSECFIDATFAAAKKGALALGRPSAARGPRSWQLRTAMVFLSPSTQSLLARMKSPLSKLPLSNALLMSSRIE
jgi:transposase